MIRADLVFRQDPQFPESLPPPSDFHRVRLEGLRDFSSEEEDGIPCLECQIVSVPCPLIRSAQAPPFHLRLRVYCSESHTEEGSALSEAPIFPLTFLGNYALNFAALEPSQGELLRISRPRVYKRRPLNSVHATSPFEIFIGGPESTELLPIIEILSSPNGSKPVDKRGTSQDIMFNPSTCKRVYRGLKDIEMVKGEYNVWGVVTKIKRDPSPTSRQFIMATVYIMDEHYEGSYNFPDFQFSILSKDINDFLPLKTGSIIRIHSMRIREWSGALTGCVFDAKLVTLIKWDERGVPLPICKSSKFVWTEEDKKRSRELKAWWNETLKPKERENILSNALEIQAVRGYCRFDLYCVVISKCVIDEEDFVLTVSDGTLSSIASESFVIEDNSFSFQPREGKYQIDIFFSGQDGLFHSLYGGDSILLTQILCYSEKEVDGKPLYKFCVDRNSSSKCQKLELTHPITLEMKNKVEDVLGAELLQGGESELFSQRSVRSGRRLDELNLKSQKSYVETMSTSTFYHHQERSIRREEEVARNSRMDVSSSSSNSSSLSLIDNEAELYQCLRSVFTSIETENQEENAQKRPLTNLQDIPKLLTKPFGHFTTQGIIKAVLPRNPLSMLITICRQCSHARQMESLEDKEERRQCIKCSASELIVSFNFILVLQKDYDYIDVFVSGCNAELFLGIQAQEFLGNRRAQGEILNKFRHFVLNRRVELNVAFSNTKGSLEYYSMGQPKFIGNTY